MTKRKKSAKGKRALGAENVPRIVVIGGGTGTFVVLSALRNCRVPLHLSAIVTMADSGGSTGRLRDQYGVLPPGDVRRALVALSDASYTLRDLFNYEFKTGDLQGHKFGNIFLTALEKMTGSFGAAVKEAARVLNINGKVIPVTLDNINLFAELTDGTIVSGETNIDIPKHDPNIPIKRVWLEPAAKINPDARGEILAADVIIIGPGDTQTSIIPNLLVRGMLKAIRESRARKIYICNLMTKHGETNGFRAKDFLDIIERYLGKNILDYAVFNNQIPSASILKRYRKENAYFVAPDGLDSHQENPRIILADLIEPGRFVRHDPNKKLVKVLLPLF
ncbi:MAG: YvcK family protein [Candidatus Yanofskybacteria bacterium]|nr:YvcK family protein [Candidatus Yanofskybacteria bacterium]